MVVGIVKEKLSFRPTLKTQIESFVTLPPVVSVFSFEELRTYQKEAEDS